jgi:diguanylate cyclase (GGDEF)-like protein
MAQVVQVETDGVRFVNDTMGLSAGDELLAQIGRRLSAVAGKNRECFRLGGDDFVILSVKASEELGEFARRVVDAFDEVFDIEGFRVPVQVRVGAALLGASDTSGTEVLARCDLALERAKADASGAAVVFSGELADAACQRMMMEQELQLAIERNEFFLMFQPIVDMATGATRGFEALARWQHPERGVVPPAEFIPMAEQSGLICRIGEFVLRQACAEAVKWPDRIKISVNVSAAQFRDRGFHLQVMDALEQSGLAGSRLILEITESLLIENLDLVQHTFDRLREKGVRFALDDFGTGFSSINHLRSLRLDSLKLDKSFADRIVSDERELDVVRSIIDLSKAFDLKTTIEGVESVEQLEMMRNQGIHNAQGFYFARPMSAEDAAAMLAAEPKRQRLQVVS